MSKTVSLDVEFDGDIDGLAESMRSGAAFRYNGRPLPIRNVIRQGNRLIAIFVHRPLIVDLTEAMRQTEHCSNVRIRMSFVN